MLSIHKHICVSQLVAYYQIDTAFKKDKMKKYQEFCEKCIQGKIGFRPDFYIIEGRYKEEKERPKENIDVPIVSPTKAAVDQAKSKLRLEN